MKVDEEQAKLLRIPAISLPRYANLSDISSSDIILFDPTKITYKLQETIVSYYSQDSLIEGMDETYWLTILKSRQGGSSNTNGLCIYPMVSYTPGLTAVVAADTKDRANIVFDRINLTHNMWPEAIRTDRESSNEFRSHTTVINSKIKVESMEKEDVGVGLSADIFVGSETPLWSNAEKQMSALIPAMINRKRSRMVLESTPQPLSAPSGQYWMDHWLDTLTGDGRWRGVFVPFWDSKINSRPWPKGQKPTLDELRLLDQFGGTDAAGHPGLTLDNLEFRRWIMATDKAVRRNPDLFRVWYPFDDQTCWIDQGTGVVPNHAIERHLRQTLYPEDGMYNEFPDPYPVNPDAIYLIVADPAGYGQDHHAFHVLEMWHEEWIQVASFGASYKAHGIDPNKFAEILFKTGEKFNWAKIAVERTGVGLGPNMLLQNMRYPNLHYDDMNKPGVHKGNQEEWLEKFIDALMDKLVIRGKKTALQVKGYRHDKMTEKTQRAELLRPDSSGGRRERGHWDKVSALMIAPIVAHRLPKRYKHREEPTNVIPFDRMTFNQHMEYAAAVQRLTQTKRRRLRYTFRK